MEQKKISITYQNGNARDSVKYPYGVEYMLALVPVEMSSRKDEIYFDLYYGKEFLDDFDVKDDMIELYAEMGLDYDDADAYLEDMFFDELKAEIRNLAIEAGINPDAIDSVEIH